MRLVVLGCAVLLSAAGFIYAETPVFPVGELGSESFDSAGIETFIRSWLLCGPIPNPSGGRSNSEHHTQFDIDFLKDIGGEESPQIEEGAVIQHSSGKAVWVRYDEDGIFVDLDKALSEEDAQLAYAYCEIESSCTQACFLGLGSNDGGRLWLNGELVWDLPKGRPIRVDDDLIPVILQKGCNTILLKIEERARQWGFVARFIPFDSQRFANERKRLFRVLTRQDGTAVLRTRGASGLLGRFIEEAHLRVCEEANPQTAVFEADWKGEEIFPLDLPKDGYAEYVLHLDLTLAGGIERTMSFEFSTGAVPEYALFDGGKTDYRIVLPKDATESEVWAAHELRHWLRETSGADFPIQTKNESPNGKQILLGWTKQTQALLGANYKKPESSDESFTYRNVGSSLLIWGGSSRGTMYGVMTFLERELGIRWYAPDVTHVPKRSQYHFHSLSHTEVPTLRIRDDYYYHIFDPEWLARNKMNGTSRDLPVPGGVERYWGVHTYYKLMPPSEFFEKHPEYYSLIEGKRTHERAELCLTNPDVLDIFTERIKKVMREHPQYKIYSVSQNDWAGPCECESCQAIVDREGSQSGPVLWFANQVAERIEKEFPDKTIGTLAYHYTRTPCKTMRPRENVVVRLCNIECCFAHPLSDCQVNAAFMRDLEAWSKIAPRMYIWDYVVNFEHYYLPFPNFNVLQANVRTFTEHNAIGILEQGSYHTPQGEFAHLRAYVLSKVLWNSECNVDEVIDDFMYGYYGKSGQFVHEYFDLLQNLVTPFTHFKFWIEPDDLLFSDGFTERAFEILDRAELAAENDTIRRRVEIVRMPVMYLKCYRSPSEAKRDGTYERLDNDFTTIGMTAFSERGSRHVNAFREMMDKAE